MKTSLKCLGCLNKQNILYDENICWKTFRNIVIDWLIAVLRPAQEYFTYRETSPLPVKGCKNVGLSSALSSFEQGGVFIVTHLLWHRTSVFPVSSEEPTHSFACHNTLMDVEELF
jgi:hypothetical protein